MSDESNFWSKRPTLVTGATGLLGSWVTRRLLDAGADVWCLVREGCRNTSLSGRAGNRPRVVQGDVTDAAALSRALGQGQIDTVFHLAAQTIVTVANRDPARTFETNVRGTWLLLEACRSAGSVAQIVLASSDKAYGASQTLPYTEDMPLRGEQPYEASKACADLIAQSYAASFGLPVAITRCGNFYGGGDLNWSRVVPGTIRSIYQGVAPVIRTNGKLVRDYLHVEDGAAANLLLAERLAQDPALRGRAFNFSTEERLTVLELVERISRIMKSSFSPRVLGEPHREIPEQWLSAARARSELGWRPHRTLDEGLEQTVAWYCSYFERQSSAEPRRTSPSAPPPAA